MKSMNSGESATVIGRSIKIRGEVSGSDDLLIDGEVEGTIHLPGARLTVGPEGRIRAGLFAQNVVVAGRVQGEVRATDSVHLRSTAVVLGGVVAPRLSIDEEAVLRGQVDLSPTPPKSPEVLKDSDKKSSTAPLFGEEPREMHRTGTSEPTPAPGLFPAETKGGGDSSELAETQA